MSNIEVLMLALDAYPEQHHQIQLSSDPAQWLKANGTLDVVQPRVPAAILQRIHSDLNPPSANPLQLDDETIGVLQRALRVMPPSLVERGKAFLDAFNNLNWDAPHGRWIANVQDTRWYGVSLTRRGDEDCSCAFFRENRECKHTAALRLLLIREFQGGEPIPLKPAAPVKPAASLQVLRALDGIRRAGGQLRAAAPAAETTKKQAVYLLELVGTDRKRPYELVPRTRSFTKTSGWRLDTTTDLRRLQGRFSFSVLELMNFNAKQIATDPHSFGHALVSINHL